MASLKPVLRFYDDNKSAGLESAVAVFAEQVPEKSRIENLAFLILGESSRLHEKADVVAAVIAKFEARQSTRKSAGQKLCSLCGTSDFPVLNEPHGMIKKGSSG